MWSGKCQLVMTVNDCSKQGSFLRFNSFICSKLKPMCDVVIFTCFMFKVYRLIMRVNLYLKNIIYYFLGGMYTKVMGSLRCLTLMLRSFVYTQKQYDLLVKITWCIGILRRKKWNLYNLMNSWHSCKRTIST